jgi:hypothetical protein
VFNDLGHALREQHDRKHGQDQERHMQARRSHHQALMILLAESRVVFVLRLFKETTVSAHLQRKKDQVQPGR